MVARQVRRSVVMSNLQIRLLPMDSDRTPLGKGKNVLHGAVRAAPLEHSVEQPCVKSERPVACPRGDVEPCEIDHPLCRRAVVNSSLTKPEQFERLSANARQA